MVTIVRSIYDEIDVGDNTFYYSRHPRDSIAVSESILTRLLVQRTTQDTTSLSETLARHSLLRRARQDTITTSEGIHITGQEQTYTRNISDTIILLQNIIAVKEEFRKLIHPEQPFYPRRRKSRFQRRFEYMT